MADTKTLTDHDAIREWAAARLATPAMRPEAPFTVGSDEPVILFLFDVVSDPEQYRLLDRPPTLGRPEAIEWDEWFRIFDERQLALVVAKEDRRRVVDSFYELAVR